MSSPQSAACRARPRGASVDRRHCGDLRRPSIAVCEHVFVRWRQPHDRRRRAGAPARLPRRGGRPPLRRARGPRHPVLRGPREVRPQPRARGLPGPVPLDDQPVPGMHPCLHRTALRATRRSSWPTADRSRWRIFASATRSSAPSVDGRYRRYVETEVLAHWSTVKPAYRVDARGRDRAHHERRPPLPDRPRLEARRPAAMCGASQRPYLTPNNTLLGTGGFADAARAVATTTAAATSAG